MSERKPATRPEPEAPQDDRETTAAQEKVAQMEAKLAELQAELAQARADAGGGTITADATGEAQEGRR